MSNLKETAMQLIKLFCMLCLPVQLVFAVPIQRTDTPLYENIMLTRPDGDVSTSGDAGKPSAKIRRSEANPKAPDLKWEYTDTFYFTVDKILPLPDGSFVISGGSSLYSPDIAKVSGHGKLQWRLPEKRSPMPLLGGNVFLNDSSIVHLSLKNLSDPPLFMMGPLFMTKVNIYGEGFEQNVLEGTENTIIGYPVSIATQDGGFLLASSQSLGADSVRGSLRLHKTDKEGQMVWTANIPRSDNSKELRPLSILEESDGYVIFCANFIEAWGFYNSFIAKVRHDGSLVWREDFPNSVNERLWAGTKHGDGYALVNSIYTEKGWRVAITKTGPDGKFSSREIYDSGIETIPQAVCDLSDGGLAIAGYHRDQTKNESFYLLTLDNSLRTKREYVWRKDTVSACLLRSVTELSDGNLIVGGAIRYFPYLAKVDMQAVSAVNDGKTAADALFVHPNPASSVLHISVLKYIKGFVEISVYDALGVKVADIYKGEVDREQTSFQVPIDGLSTGSYFVRVSSAGTSQTARFSVVR